MEIKVAPKTKKYRMPRRYAHGARIVRLTVLMLEAGERWHNASMVMVARQQLAEVCTVAHNHASTCDFRVDRAEAEEACTEARYTRIRGVIRHALRIDEAHAWGHAEAHRKVCLEGNGRWSTYSVLD